MPAIIISALLMYFLLWSYKNIYSKTADVIVSPIKRLVFVIGLFIFCYIFILISSNLSITKTDRETVYINQNNIKSEQTEVPNNIDAPFAGANSKGKRFSVIPAEQINTKFSEVAGLHEAKDEVQDIIKFLKNPEQFSRLGAKSPKGAIFYGEPGTGKTLLARAIAGESKVAFISVAGSEFDEEWVGVGAARVRQLFETARENAPCIIFIDEIDALAAKRHAPDLSGRAQTVNQLLAEMDGLDDVKNKGIIVIGASNNMKIMDPAILRPGRLDRHIKIDVPTIKEREEILNVHMKKIVVSPKVTIQAIAKMTPGFSGADLANLVNEAAILATKQDKSAVEMQDFDVAKDRIILGSKRESLKISDKVRKVTAYHEAGHALIGHLLSAEDNPIYKVTITPRGPALGYTSFEPNKDEYSITLQQIEDRIAMQLAGRIAEEIVFGEKNTTTGAENDLKNATQLAYSMVTRWGYSKRVGLMYQDSDSSFVPKDVIEKEVQTILNNGYERAKKLLIENRVKLDRLSAKLLEQETLDAKQVKEILDRK